MQKNVGGIDRIARLIIGPILIAAALAMFAGLFAVGVGFVATVAPIVALVLGAVLTVTGYTRTCPIWNALGVNTYTGRSRSESESPVGRAP